MPGCWPSWPPGRAPEATSFDPLPMLRRLAETCADVPGFSVEARLVVGVFPEVVPALVADLEVRGPALVRHPTVRLLAGPLSDTSPAAGGRPASAPVVLDADAEQQALVDAVVAGGRTAVRAPAGSGRRRRWPTRSPRSPPPGGRSLLLSAATPTSWPTSGAGWPPSGWATSSWTWAPTRTTVPWSLAGCSRSSRRRTRSTATTGTSRRISRPPTSLTASLTSTEAAEARAGEQAAVLAAHIATMHHRHEPWGVSAYAAQVALAELTALRPAPRSRVRLPAEVLDALNPHRIAELRGILREAAGIGAFRTPPARRPLVRRADHLATRG